MTYFKANNWALGLFVLLFLNVIWKTLATRMTINTQIYSLVTSLRGPIFYSFLLTGNKAYTRKTAKVQASKPSGTFHV